MKTRSLVGVATILTVIGAIAGAVYYEMFVHTSSTPTFTPTLVPTPTPTPTPMSTPTPSPSPTPPPSPYPSPTPPESVFSCTVYFTPNSQVADYLVEAINSAQKSVYAAFYDLDLVGVADALLEAYLERQIDVKVVVDSDNMDNPAVNSLVEAGIAVGDDDPDFMHNKFMIIDDELVWTGSMNPTFNGVNKNNNNVVVVTGCAELVEDFKQEFNELWNGVFGAGDPVPYSEITVNASFSLEVYFAPEDDVEDQIIDEIESAEEAIYFATFTFTSQNVADALIAEHDEGVVVNGIYESFQVGRYSTYDLLLENGIEVTKDKNPAVMHNKFFVIDNRTVITGSYNPTKHANEGNDENVLIIHSKAIAETFAAEFKKLWREWYTSTPTPSPAPKPSLLPSF